MKYVYLVLSWIFGFTFAISGLVIIFSAPYGGLAFLACAALLLPPIRNFVFSKSSRQISGTVRGWTVAILAIVGLGFFSQYSSIQEDRIKREVVAKEEQKQIEYFKQNSQQILADAEKAYDEQRYKDVLNAAQVFAVAGNSQLATLGINAKQELDKNAAIAQAAKLAKIQEERTIEIVALLKTVPTSNYRQNLNLYRELVGFHPSNATYQEKFDFYKAKFAAQQEREKIAALEAKARAEAEAAKAQRESNALTAKYGRRPTQSGWDGSYHVVQRYLEQIANDPDSIEIDGCTKVYQAKEGWLVGCNYRGRNGFGGMIKQANWFTIVHDRVVQMHDYSAYSE